jgi:hypothetical protein
MDVATLVTPPQAAPRARRKTAHKTKPRCEDCFFFQNQLCALEEKRPCPTFRPAHPDGLRPPRQLSFAFRSDRRVTLPAAPPRDS